MSLEALGEDSVRRYSIEPPRSLIAMFSRRTRGFVIGPASHVLVRPFVVFAARALGPGPTRLKLVKLAHNLDHQPLVALPHELHKQDDRAAVNRSQRAA